jgi:YidC/Oxa1 family membrane protein insertase
MEKRLILAMSLSMLVLLAWSAFLPKTQPIDNKRVASRNLVTQTTTSLPDTPRTTTPPRLIKLARDQWEVTFDEGKAAIQSAEFKNFQNYKFMLQNGYWLSVEKLKFREISTGSSGEVAFVYQDQQQKITKRFLVSNSNYTIELDLEVANLSPHSIDLDLPLVLGVLNFANTKNQMNFASIGIATQEKIFHQNGHKDATFLGVRFLGLRERYFCTILEPLAGNYSAFIRRLTPQTSEVGLSLQGVQLARGNSFTQKFRIYLGPQDLKVINAANPNWAELINFGAFDVISRLVLRVLEFIYSLVHNWGLSIIILSLLVYALLYPLSLKQMHSMKEMQSLQPKIEEIRQAYKDNPKKMNVETMNLYREHKVNPLSGCLPLILQIPIFFALYQALIRFVSLKGANFLWIKDLSEPDRLFLLPISLPVLGNEINILPILMAIGMFVQQKISMKLTVGSSAEQQKMMLILLPVMFGVIFYHMSSGFVLYWFVNSILMLLFQLKMHYVK